MGQRLYLCLRRQYKLKNNILPRYGRVVLVDDHYNEVIMIQHFLAEHGIPYIFYDYAEMQDMDIQKVDGIRLLFLDIRLEDGTTDEKTINSILAFTVEKIIPVKNGPYGIVLWTNEFDRRDSVAGYLEENLNENETTRPLFISAIDKKDFSDGNYEELVEEINKKYDEQKMISFMTEIENRTMEIPSRILKMISYDFVQNIDNSELEKLFLRFVSCEQGENCASSQGATRTILRQWVGLIKDRYMEIVSDEEFVRKIASYWTFDFTNQDELKNVNKEKTLEQVADVNTSLNVNIHADASENVPGKVYRHNDSKTLAIHKDVLYKSTFSSKKEGNTFGELAIKYNSAPQVLKLTPIEMDITPNCDYAQAKNHMLRTVYGYIVNVENVGGITVKKINNVLREKSYDYIYITPVFKVNGIKCLLMLNTKMLYIEPHGYQEKLEYVFRLNEEITNEIRKKAAENILRLGINSL